jgi:hypothetical protein
LRRRIIITLLVEEFLENREVLRTIHDEDRVQVKKKKKKKIAARRKKIESQKRNCLDVCVSKTV